MQSKSGGFSTTPVAKAVPYDNSITLIGDGSTQSAIDAIYGLTNIAAGAGLFGAGTDGAVSLSAGTTTLQRDMYYTNLTLSGTAVLNTNGYKIYVNGTLSMSGSSSIVDNGANGGNASGTTAGAGAAQNTGVTVGSGTAGGNGGGQQNAGAAAAGTVPGYGGNGGNGGASSNAGGLGATLTYLPERIFRHDHLYNAGIKQGGAGGGGGGGGNPSFLATAAAGGGGGAGGGVIMIFAQIFTNTSTVGILARGGNGGNGGNAASGNSTGGAGGGGGGGGFIYIISLQINALGILDVSGGTGGIGGNGAGGGANGGNGVAGQTGHYSAFYATANQWTVL